MSKNTITTVAEFVARVADIKREQVTQDNKSDLLFRGQPYDKPLLPKLWRVRPRGKNLKIEKLEDLLFTKFNRDGLPFHEFEPKDDWDRLALAQHHGLPTRLLDWTFSAPAALWFTVRNSPQKMDDDGTRVEIGVVWVLCANIKDFRLDTKNYGPFDNNSRAPLIFRPKAISRRILAQSAAFTIHRPIGKELVALEKHPRYEKKLVKLIVPHSAFPSIRQELHMFNANWKSLFPDLDGLCRHLSWRHTKLEDEP
jgi:hypothetical protein